MHKHFSRLFLVLSLATATGLSAQTSVWKISKGGHAIYLAGTCHMLRASDFPLPDAFETAYAAADELCFETDIARRQEPATQQLILSRGMYGAEGSLQTELSPEAWAAVQQYCTGAGLPEAMINKFRPWLFAVTVAALELQKLGATDEGVDLHLHKRATADAKPTHGLEAFEDHLEFIFHMGDGQESQMVIHYVEEAKEIPGMFDDVVAAWRKGDLGSIDELLTVELRRDYPKVYDALIVQRNQDWLPQLETMLTSAPVELVLVGVGHIAGEEGLLHLLQARGCTIEQLGATP